MLTGYRLRLYPDAEQQQDLLRGIRGQRLIYNATVQENRYFRRFARRMVGTAGMPVPGDQQYSHFITDCTVFLRAVPSQVLRNGAVQFRQAYQRFFRKLGGRSKLRRKTGRQSIWRTSELFQFVPVTNEATGEVKSSARASGPSRSCLHTVRRYGWSAHSHPQTIGGAQPRLSVHAGNIRIMRTTMPPW